MRWSPAAWGLDFSDGTVKAVLISRKRGRLIVEKAAKIPASGPGESGSRPKNGLGTAEREGLLTWLRDSSPGIDDRLVIGFPSTGARQTIVSLPPFVGEKLQDAARFEAERLAPGSDLDDLATFFRVLRGRTEADVPALLIAISKERLGGVRRDLDQIGIAPDGMELEGLGAAHYLELDQSVPPPYLAIQVNRVRTDLIFGLERGCRTRSLPFGAGSLIRESRMRRERCDEYAQRLVQEIRWAQKEIFGDLRAWHPGSTLLIGEGAKLPELGQALANALPEDQAPAPQVPSHLRRIKIAESVPQEIKDELPLWATSIGLALSGLRKGPVSLSVVPKNRARSARRFAPKAAALSWIGGTALLGLTLKAQWEASDLDQIVLEEVSQSVKARRGQLSRLQEQYLGVVNPTQELAFIAEERQSAALAVHQVMDLFPIAASPGIGVCYLDRLRVRSQDGIFALEADVTASHGDEELFVPYFQELFRPLSAVGVPSLEPLGFGRSEEDPARFRVRASVRTEL